MDLGLTVLCILLLSQQVYYGYQMHILLNKLMSRNYSEYEMARPRKEDIKINLKPKEVEEDLNYLNSLIPR